MSSGSSLKMMVPASGPFLAALVSLCLGGQAIAGPKEEFAALKERAEALSLDCTEASNQLLASMSPTPKLDAAKSAASFSQVECGNVEVELWKVGRVTNAPIETKRAVDMWLSKLRHIAFNRYAMARKAERYIMTKEVIFLDHFQNIVTEDTKLQELSRQLLADAELAVSLPPKKRQTSALSTSKKRELDSFISRTRGLISRCEDSSSKLDTAMEAPPKREEAAIIAPKVIAACAASEKSLSQITRPSGLPKDVAGWLESWGDEMAALAGKRTEAAKAALNFATDGASGEVEAYLQYKFGEWDKKNKAADYLTEATLNAGIRNASDNP